MRNNEIVEYCNSLNNELRKSITKIGLVKYDTYSNTKNKLSFALALLNRNNDVFYLIVFMEKTVQTFLLNLL